MDRLNKISAYLATFPTTQFRILASVFAYAATTVAVLGFHVKPDIDFYGFLLIWGGLDVTQFLAKRATFKPE